MQTLYHHLKQRPGNPKGSLALLLALLLVASCAPARTGKQPVPSKSAPLPGAQKKQGEKQQPPIGHDLEVILRKSSKDNDLIFLIRDRMDRYDREQTNHIFERGLSGQTLSWTNPDQGNQYRITPLPAYQTIGNSVCRKAQIEAMLNGNEQRIIINSKACRTKNGHWRISQE